MGGSFPTKSQLGQFEVMEKRAAYFTCVKEMHRRIKVDWIFGRGVPLKGVSVQTAHWKVGSCPPFEDFIQPVHTLVSFVSGGTKLVQHGQGLESGSCFDDGGDVC